MIGGIRFYAQDVTRPFVEVIAHDFSDLNELAEVVAGEWCGFHPGAMRLRQSTGAPLGVRWIDTSLYAGRMSEMARDPQVDLCLSNSGKTRLR